MDNLTTEILDGMEISELAELPPEALSDLHWQVGEELVRAKARENKLNQVLEARYAEGASKALLAEGRDTGTVHLTDGRYDVTVTRPKRVKWNDVALRRALDAMDPDTARHIASITIKVDERKFTAATPAIQALLADARTVETGKATYALSERKAA